ncbi:uncharacterized protein LOC132304834 [Cornus florida]|uniref:uncharacterized protein LOC132304834 n=1 Tax=Cornus florida TaxID=4283 RepID=UPI00289A43A4|nr:uncharacterized protein LOC132304834 [Cornus florida]
MLIARGEFAGYIQGPAVEQSRPTEQVKRNQKPNSHNLQPVRVINAIHGRPEREESDELLRVRLRQAHMKRRIGSVNTLHQQSASTPIKFDKTDLLRVQIPHEDPLVISLTVAECLVRRVLIDLGSSANVMSNDTFDRLEIKPDRLKPTGNPLLGFDGKRAEPIDTVEVVVHAVERVLMETFVVVEILPSYNLLMGKGWIHRVQGVPSTLHQVMRCLGPDGTKEPPPKQNGEEEPVDLTEEPLVDVQIDRVRPERTTRVGVRLAEEEKQELVDFLSQNADVFALSHLDMPRINHSVSCHSLNINPNARPVKQKQRRFAPERTRIIAEEVDRLLDGGFIREVYYPDWLSNIVVIPMDSADKEKTSFVTKHGTYCYKVMSFGLKNAEATYQRLISKIFKGQIGKTVEAYIDDIVVKSKKKVDHLKHLQDVFDVLRQYGMKLNPTKCSFGVSSGQFLGHVVNHRGIEASPAQAEALTKKVEPTTIKEVQTLARRIAALSRFISKLSDRYKPFFDTI